MEEYRFEMGNLLNPQQQTTNLITGLLAPNADERLKRETIEVMVERLN
jgi:hypothetical protein